MSLSDNLRRIVWERVPTTCNADHALSRAPPESRAKGTLPRASKKCAYAGVPKPGDFTYAGRGAEPGDFAYFKNCFTIKSCSVSYPPNASAPIGGQQEKISHGDLRA